MLPENRAQSRLLLNLSTAILAVSLAPPSAFATTISGTVDFQGSVVFVTPIAGITESDLTVSSGPGIEATGSGEKCDILADGSAPVGAGGAYPDSGTLSVQIELDKGGNNPPDGTCLIQLRARGNDGASVSASGSVIVEVTAADIGGNATIVVPDDLLVRQSKTLAGLDKDCLKWTKKQIKLRGKCNYQLWKKGPIDGAAKCKDADVEPAECDPADYVEQVLQFSFDNMNQQVDPPSAEVIDLTVLKDQSKCQRSIGKAAANFIIKRNTLVQKHCIDKLIDDDSCRSTAGNDAKKRLAQIDKCVTDQGTDLLTGLTLADVDEPCDSQCISGGTIDRKCLKDCFQLELSTLSDGLVGDVPECGNGVVQGTEVCDDGNLDNGDCCSDVCGFEPTGSQTCGVGECEATADQCAAGEPVVCTPGAPGDESIACADGLDNDCDGLTDAFDTLDCP